MKLSDLVINEEVERGTAIKFNFNSSTFTQVDELVFNLNDIVIGGENGRAQVEEAGKIKLNITPEKLVQELMAVSGQVVENVEDITFSGRVQNFICRSDCSKTVPNLPANFSLEISFETEDGKTHNTSLTFKGIAFQPSKEFLAKYRNLTGMNTSASISTPQAYTESKMKLAQIKPLNESNTGADYSRTEDVSAHLMGALKHKIAILNRKAQKLGTPPIELEVVDEFYKKSYNDDDQFDTQQKYYKVKVTGEAPHIPGYSFLATIQHKDGGNIIRQIPGADNVDMRQFHDADPGYCDHCKKKRRRIDTYIIRDDSSGELRQVGRNCLADFLGGTDPKAILYYFSISDRMDRVFNDLDDDYSGPKAERVEYTVGLDQVLLAAAYFVNRYGYVKAQTDWDDTSGKIATAQQIRWFFFERSSNPDDKREKNKIKNKIEDNSELKKYVDDARKWFESIPQEKKDYNNFLHNLDVAMNSERVSYRDVGIVGALFAAYERHLHKQEERKEKSNDFIGSPGDKLKPTNVTVKTSKYIDTQYGTTQLVKMEDENGNSITWWNSGAKNMEAGAKYRIVGTIKKHDEYRGRNTTVVTRVKFEER